MILFEFGTPSTVFSTWMAFCCGSPTRGTFPITSFGRFNYEALIALLTPPLTILVGYVNFTHYNNANYNIQLDYNVEAELLM